MPQQVNRIGEYIDRLRAEMRAAELKTAERIEVSAKNRVPVDENAKTHLRDAIHTHEDEEGVWVIAGDKKHWYGHIIEHGSVKMAPRPFLIPAVEENAEQFVEDVREAMRRAT